MRKKVLLLGASTGGPSLIKEILANIKSLNTTIVIVQHMREEVIPFFIKDLEESLPFEVYTTPTVTNFEKPSIIVCSESSIVKTNAQGYEFLSNDISQKYTPDINMLLKSFENFTNKLDISVLIMTGIGRDGIDGAKVLKNKGVKIYAQDEKSSPVYGMPKAAFETGIVDEVKSFDEIKAWIKEF